MTRDTILAILDVHLSSHKAINGKGEAADRILAEMEEPLWKLAERKGVSIEATPPSFYRDKGGLWDIMVCVPEQGVAYSHEAPTYSEAEKSVRAYLEGLDGVKGGR